MTRALPGAINGETFDHFIERIYDMTTRGKTQWLREDLLKFANSYASEVRQQERERLAKERGNLLDRWDMMANDTKGLLLDTEDAFCNAMEAIRKGEQP